ncbi:hypothetical protein BDV98DRAFT_566586 [Pterulicium gracile]|uniref:protein-tyrosine-phosphatase n=1 Tax=Pterulicium gracile TaxID=1884261 RepID=A0A5C3QP31_9AGAR|nr:hypothetical protein BDV98DRAFT_566586 [Pterula gracilis]
MLSSFASVDSIIDDKLYIANLRAATTPSLLASLGITHVLSVCPDHPLTRANANATSLGECSTSTIHDSKPEIQHLAISVQDSEYAEILPFLPRACTFIHEALSAKGARNRVLVHCVMGVSRSATVIAAYLMKTRRISHLAAISLIRQRRPVVHPNYGFRRQLQVFGAANYFEDIISSNSELSTEEAVRRHEQYGLWKRAHKRTMRPYLRVVQDTLEVIRDEVSISSELPVDPEQADSLLYDHGISHVLALSPVRHLVGSAVVIYESVDTHDHISTAPSSSQLASQGRIPVIAIPRLTESCRYIQGALEKGGQVLVYAEKESMACAGICAYMIFSKKFTTNEAVKHLQEALPLFQPTTSFMRTLAAFEHTIKAPVPPSPSPSGSSTTNIHNRRSRALSSAMFVPMPSSPHTLRVGPFSPSLSPPLLREGGMGGPLSSSAPTSCGLHDHALRNGQGWLGANAESKASTAHARALSHQHPLPSPVSALSAAVARDRGQSLLATSETFTHSHRDGHGHGTRLEPSSGLQARGCHQR